MKKYICFIKQAREIELNSGTVNRGTSLVSIQVLLTILEMYDIRHHKGVSIEYVQDYNYVVKKTLFSETLFFIYYFYLMV